MQTILRRWLLPVSLSLNAFLLVLVLWHPRPPHGPPDPRHIVDHMVEDMRPADAAIIREVFARHAPALGNGHTNMEAFAGRVRAALEMPQPDIAALRAAFADAKHARNQFDDVMEAVITESAPLVSPDARTKLFRPPGGPGKRP